MLAFIIFSRDRLPAALATPPPLTAGIEVGVDREVVSRVLVVRAVGTEGLILPPVGGQGGGEGGLCRTRKLPVD